MLTSPSSQLTNTGAIISQPGASVAAPAAVAVAPTIPVRLDSNNFMLWRGLVVPNLPGASLHGYLDGSTAAPEKTITEGTGDDAVIKINPEYHRWWTQDQKVLGLLLASMSDDIACQMIGCKTAAALWKAVNAMFSAKSRASVRHVRRQLQSLRKADLSAAEYMHKMKALADVMATAGHPIDDDELVDYILTGLGPDYNSIAASISVSNESMSYSDFYSLVLSFEGLQAQQSQAEGWSSSANPTARPGSYGNGECAPPQEFHPTPYGGGQPV